MTKISKQEGGRDEQAVMAEYLGKEVEKVLGGGTYTKAKPFIIEMHRPLQYAPEWKEYLAIYSQEPNAYTLVKGTQAVRGAEIEGFDMTLKLENGQWKFVTQHLDYNYSFAIFAFLKQVNEGAIPPQEQEKGNLLE